MREIAHALSDDVPQSKDGHVHAHVHAHVHPSRLPLKHGRRRAQPLLALEDASSAANLSLENIVETEGGHAANLALENIAETEGRHAEQDGNPNASIEANDVGECSEANCTDESEGEAHHDAEEEPDSVSESSSDSTSGTSVSHLGRKILPYWATALCNNALLASGIGVSYCS